MRIILTGASGFVGQNLQPFLQTKGYVVQSLSLRNEDWRDTIYNDARSLIHLAGKAHDTKGVDDPSDYYRINTQLTIDLFSFFLTSNIKDFFYFSSVKAVADSVSGVLEEEYGAKPQTAYGKSKRAAEEYILAQPLPQGKRFFIIRPCMIHGPGNKGNLNLLYKFVEKGIPWPLAAFNNYRSFLGIDNLKFLLEKMIVNPDICSGIYNFADDQYIATDELIRIIGEVKQRKTTMIPVPPLFINAICKIGDVVPLPMNSERLKKLTESYCVSNRKVKSALGILNLPYTAKEGLESTIRSF